jgi:hypothetical protein
MKKRNFEKQQYSDEDIQNIKFRDLIGIATPQELAILKELNIESFMLHTVKRPKDLFCFEKDPEKRRKLIEKHEKYAKKWRK